MCKGCQQVTQSGDWLNMSSPDSERVPQMSDPTNEEIEYYEDHRMWDKDGQTGPSCYRSFLLCPGILSLLGLPVLIVAVWALVQGTSYFSIAMLPTTSMIIVSALTRHCVCGHGSCRHLFHQILRST